MLLDQVMARKFEQKLQRSVDMVKSYRNVNGGSETRIVDRNLWTILDIMSQFSGRTVAGFFFNCSSHSFQYSARKSAHDI